MIIALNSVLDIYNEYYKSSNLYLLTYKLSQDHLEVYFSAVRSKSGYSNNPTCYQFTNISKKLLVHTDVKGSDYGNCITLDSTKLLQALEKDFTKDSNENVNIIITNHKTDAKPNLSCDNYGQGTNKTYIDCVVEYIAGRILIISILMRNKCYECPILLIDEESKSMLIDEKSRGRLVKPSEDVATVCKIVEKLFRQTYQRKLGIFKEIFNTCLESIPKNVLQIHHSENPKEHRNNLLRNLISKYLLIRIKHFESQKQSSTKKIRRIYSKMILFKNE